MTRNAQSFIIGIIATIAATLAVYILGIYVAWDANPANWELLIRLIGAYAIGGAFFATVSLQNFSKEVIKAQHAVLKRHYVAAIAAALIGAYAFGALTHWAVYPGDWYQMTRATSLLMTPFLFAVLGISMEFTTKSNQP